jgi:hypothetical protein
MNQPHKNRAIVRIDSTLLLPLLRGEMKLVEGLPPTAEFVYATYESRSDSFLLILQDESFPRTAFGGQYLEINVVVSKITPTP